MNSRKASTVRFVSAGLLLALLGACTPPRAPAPPAVSTAPAAPSAPVAAPPPAAPVPQPGATGTAARPDKPSARTPRRVALGPSPPAHSVAALKLQLAERLLDMHPEESYRQKAEFVVLAAPVLMIELRADGHIRRIDVLRVPKQAKDTVQMAIDAIRRVAPLSIARGVNGPLVWSETFLFDEQRRFKPRSLE